MSNYTIVKLDAENIKHLYTLFRSVYQKKCPKNYYDLKYNTTYTGADYIGFLAFENSVPVAYYGVVPIIVSINKQPVLAAQSCDTMTHPGHRKKGLFVTLAKQTFDLAKNKGIHFVFGFPNQNSYPGFIKKLGFTHTETLNRYSIPFSNTPYKLIYRKLGLINLKKKKNVINNLLIDQGYDGVIYSNDYIHYKKGYDKTLIVEENNTSFWINVSKGGWIGALSPLKKELFLQTIKAIETITNTASITFMVSPKNEFDTALSKIVKPENGFAVIIKNLSGKHNLSDLKFQFSDIDIF